ncbi:phage tail family protein [Bacillus thuringiensis]|uniref:distal tail protein Dit n=1 Tax=Bacillus cereus group TaxID=86661 RepID=UPI000CD9E7CB|nr:MULTISPECIES: distal tail protein Dit [Bacillus cereus group]MEC3417067.1 phage tail family protein [Bacillus cereus]MEC3596971.1 phage tail family protein [Bacillus thuringiensis]MED1573515.1 phage tail family protein [Bacillus paranthracis]MED1836159.1 phage tail family protein [Bacillus thuringiensis]MED2670222.1 phage tail family protein [Bacillus thuringiensis]
MITFAKKRIPDFVKVNKIGVSILPSIETNTLKVKGRAGVLDFGNEIGERRINVDITLVTPKPNEVIKYTTLLAEWLFYTELQELILDDEPDKFYRARIEGETNIDEMLTTGTGTLTFLCPSPFKESLTPKSLFFEGLSDIDPAVNGIENNGTADTFPTIELTAKEDTPAVVLKNGEDKFFQVGEDVSDIVQAMPDREVIIDDDASTLNGWTTPIKQDGVLSGEIISDGRQFLVKDGNFGSAPLYWGGAGKLKSLPRPVQDFTWKINIGFMTQQIAERGKIEFQMFDKDNKELVKFGFYETSTITNNPYVMCELGGGLRKVVNFTPQMHGLWNHFVGYLQITRSGDYWALYITVVDPVNGFEHSGQYFEWWDSDMIFGAPVAKIQFYLGTFDPDSKLPPSRYMFVRPMIFEDLKPLPPEKVPITLRKGDKVLIDCKTATIRKNGKVAYEILNPYSDFFALHKGVNVLSLAPANVDMKITYSERWL